MDNGMGQDSAGDFNQLSLDGVDFGEHYDNDHGIEPKTNESMEGSMDYQQLGANADFGVVPQGLRGVPSGLGHYPAQQLGHGYHDQLGRSYSQMGNFLTAPVSVAGIAVPGWALYGGLAAAAYWAYKKFM